ncbi:hypothetical protein MAPG_11410 [Magnaporthiopsis poae ATCC 64411]|uniref:Uncharacterized protein n=1 Tax=Magnaporthiopsis poae (strain ATCC 64411 / 73-15) TaxID=644358 RepID=A0A0C4EF72_MAGP6|nr:hypothetical protein MAPG_11410 [Magnaporthiopsis poae ATCC 64411]
MPPSSWCYPVRQPDPSQFLQGGNPNSGSRQGGVNTSRTPFVLSAQLAHLAYASAAVNNPTVQDNSGEHTEATDEDGLVNSNATSVRSTPASTISSCGFSTWNPSVAATLKRLPRRQELKLSIKTRVCDEAEPVAHPGDLFSPFWGSAAQRSAGTEDGKEKAALPHSIDSRIEWITIACHAATFLGHTSKPPPCTLPYVP